MIASLRGLWWLISHVVLARTKLDVEGCGSTRACGDGADIKSGGGGRGEGRTETVNVGEEKGEVREEEEETKGDEERRRGERPAPILRPNA